MRSKPPLKFNETIAPQERLDFDRQVESEYFSARKLLSCRQYKQSLKKFKWAFAHNAELFLSRTDAANLIKNYAPAGVVIRRWRNDKERLIRAKIANSNIVSQWDDLNWALGERDRTINVFYQLADSCDNEELLYSITSHIWTRIARSRDYERLRNYLPSLGFRVLLHAMEVECTVLFPSGRKSQSMTQTIVEFQRAFMRREAMLCFEVALGLNEKHVAKVFAEKILSVENSDRIFAGLIKSAIRARAYPETIALFQAAKERFSSRRLRESSKAIRKLPKRLLSQMQLRSVSPL